VTCNKPIPTNVWTRHLQTKRHIAALRYHRTKSAYDDLARNKHGIEISGDEGLEFCTNQGSKPVTLAVDIKLTAPGDISVIDIRLSSQAGFRFSKESPYVVLFTLFVVSDFIVH
jgi:hypothetical protein